MEIDKVVEAVKDLPGVVYVTDTLYACAQDSQEMLKTGSQGKELKPGSGGFLHSTDA